MKLLRKVRHHVFETQCGTVPKKLSQITLQLCEVFSTFDQKTWVQVVNDKSSSVVFYLHQTIYLSLFY